MPDPTTTTEPKRATRSKPSSVDLEEKVKELQSEVAILRGQFKQAIHEDALQDDRDEQVQQIVGRLKRQKEAAGNTTWYLHDRRDKEKPPVLFYSDAKDPRTALREYTERTGLRFTGSGANPYYASLQQEPDS